MPCSSKFRDALRRLENPYATLDAEPQPVVARVITAEESRREQFIRGANPCAWDYFFDEPTPQPSSPNREPIAAMPATAARLTQNQFEQRARAIFRPYIPAEEKGRLRAHHREFIARNKTRSPQVRFQLIAALAKYDLSSIPGIRPQFNREEDAFTKAKLIEIENSIEDEA